MADPLVPDYLPPETRRLPARWAITGYGVPEVCSRHGARQTRRVQMKIESDPPLWVYAFLLLGILPFFIAASATTTKLTLKSWPVCKRCTTVHRLRMLGGAGMFLLTFAVCASGGAVQNSPVAEKLVMLTVIGLFIGGIVALITSEYARVTRTRLTSDGLYVDVRKAAPEFEAAVGQAHVMAQTTSTWADRLDIPGSSATT